LFGEKFEQVESISSQSEVEITSAEKEMEL
jgi:hypothetical protein